MIERENLCNICHKQIDAPYFTYGNEHYQFVGCKECYNRFKHVVRNRDEVMKKEQERMLDLKRRGVIY